MRYALLALLLAAACEKTATMPSVEAPRPAPAPTAVREVKLPGMRVELPDWPVSQRDDRFAGGVFRMERAPGAEQIQIGWLDDDARGPPHLKPIIAETIAGMKAGGVEVELVGSYADTVHDHAATTYELRSATGTGFRAIITYWYCPRDRRVFQLRTILVSEPTHTRLIRSITCHTGGPSRPAAPRFAKFAASGFARSAERPDRVVYASPHGSVILLPSMAGTLGRTMAADSQQGRDFRAKILSLLVAAWTQERPAAAHFEGRFVRVSLTVEGLPSLAAVTAVYCKAHDAAFQVAFLGPAATPQAEIVRILSAATCPD